jgi:hypothetical protein
VWIHHRNCYIPAITCFWGDNLEFNCPWCSSSIRFTRAHTHYFVWIDHFSRKFIRDSILAVSLSGIRLNSPYGKTTCNALSNRSTSLFTTKIGRISFNHSHHSPSLIEAGHEFQIKNKYFCTGCYGLLVGSIISVVIGTIYILNGIHTTWVSILPFIVPLCFIPIMFRYLLPYKIPSSMKLIANSLLPIGCCLLLIYTDVLFYNWAYNVFIVLLIISAAYLRGIIAQIDNKERI